MTATADYCTDADIAVDTSGYGSPHDPQAHVSVQITCQLDLSDLVVSGFPGSVTLHGHSDETLDTLREW